VSPYTIAIQVTAVLTLWCALAVWQRDRRALGARWFIALAAAVLVWCLGELLAQWGLIDEYGRDRIVYLGIVSVPALWMGVAAHAANLDVVRRVPWLPAALLTPGLFCYALLYMGPWADLYVGPGDGEGPLFPVFVLYGYVLTLGGVACFVRAARRWPKRGFYRRAIALAVSVLIPLVGNAVYLWADLGIDLDPTPVLLGFAVVPMRGALFGSSFFDVLPIDQRAILRDLPVGVLISDATGAVLELNHAAERRLGLARSFALGRSLEALLETLPANVRVRTAPVAGASEARCTVID
jgi:PAS domain-containing protein